MSADNPWHWIAGAAVIVGTFVAAAVCSSPPKALDFAATTHRVVFAENQQQAIAKVESLPSVPRSERSIAARSAPVHKQKLAQNQLPQIPAYGSIMAAAAVVTSPDVQGGLSLVHPSAKTDIQSTVPLVLTGAQVTGPRGTDVLIAARPVRGPPAV